MRRALNLSDLTSEFCIMALCDFSFRTIFCTHCTDVYVFALSPYEISLVWLLIAAKMETESKFCMTAILCSFYVLQKYYTQKGTGSSKID
jgi:hypothetical protein